jgi:hypothetical protein
MLLLYMCVLMALVAVIDATESAQIHADVDGNIAIATARIGADIMFGNSSMSTLNANLQSVQHKTNQTLSSVNALLNNVAILNTESTVLAALHHEVSQSISALESSRSSLSSSIVKFLANPFSFVRTCARRTTPQRLRQTSALSFATFTGERLNSHNEPNFYLFSLDNPTSNLFVWNPDTLQFSMILNISTGTNGIYMASAFSARKEHFLAIAYTTVNNSFSLSRVDIYVLDELAPSLTSIQTIPASAAAGTSAAVIGTTTFLAIANALNDTAGATTTYSYIMRLNSSTLLFSHFQNISTQSTTAPLFFTINSDTYLAFPSYPTNTSSAISVIYKYDAASDSFILQQSIPGARVVQFLVLSFMGDTYLLAVMPASFSVAVYTHSASNSTFTLTSTVATPNYFTSGVSVVTEYDKVRLIVTSSIAARQYTCSNMSATCDMLDLPVSGSVLSHTFNIGADSFVAVNDSVYKFCDNVFVWE